jgi:hypothetical protein
MKEIVFGEGMSHLPHSAVPLTMGVLSVVMMYSQGNYKGAKHEWLPSVDNIGIPSYINIQVY